ncbi:hypothetical protein FQA39_LY11666 [Lamprigera yunnana]|nr:hypothetical protein FQA39_LY11666 [Lamprigera yunnana]
MNTGVTNVKEWQEINLALKRESLFLNDIFRPKTPGKCKDGSEGSSINHHQRTGPMLAPEINLKQVEPFQSQREMFWTTTDIHQPSKRRAGVTNVKEWQEINLALKRESLFLNDIFRPKTPGKCKDGSEGSSINHHQRTGPMLAPEINLKQVEPFQSQREMFWTTTDIHQPSKRRAGAGNSHSIKRLGRRTSQTMASIGS